MTYPELLASYLVVDLVAIRARALPAPSMGEGEASEGAAGAPSEVDMIGGELDR